MMHRFPIWLIVCMILGCSQRGDAQTAAATQWTPTETWAWTQIADGRIADFDELCQSANASHTTAALPAEPCREIRGGTIEQMLTRAPWRDAIPPAGLRLAGAHVSGDIDLANAHIGSAVALARSFVGGSISLARSRLDGFFALDGSMVTGQIIGSGLQSDSDVSLSDGRRLPPSMSSGDGFHGQGNVALSNAQIKGALFLNAGSFDKGFDISNAHVGGDVQTSGAHFHENLLGTSLQVAGKLAINATRVDGAVKFPSANIGGWLDAESSAFARLNLIGAKVAGELHLIGLKSSGDVNLSAVQLTGDLLLTDPDAGTEPLPDGFQNCSSLSRVTPDLKGDVVLTGAAIGGSFQMSYASVAGNLVLNGLSLSGTLRMDRACILKRVEMGSLHVGGDLRLTAAQVSSTLASANLDVVHDLDLSLATFSKDVGLFEAQIGNTFHLEDARFHDVVVAPGLRSASDLKLQRAEFASAIDLRHAKLGGDLDLSDAHLSGLDLSGSTIDGALLVDQGTAWSTGSTQLSLVNTHAGALQDAGGITEEECPADERDPPHNGWPAVGMQLDGFTYDHLGSLPGAPGANMRRRNVCWWRWWLQRDATFSEQPYLQLAAVMSAHGDKDNAAAIAYFSRRRETAIAWANGYYGRWLLLTLFAVTVGYGIGGYSLRALLWVAGITVIGSFLLKRAPGGKGRPPLWLIGASLARVLPAIEINREFTDFFDDPERKRLTDRQVAIFSVIAVLGWALGIFILAAISGLTQHS